MQIRFYAAAADAAGATQLDLAASLTPDELSARLVALRPGLEGVLTRCSLLVDGQSAPPDTPIPASARVDVLPPFAGG